MPAKATLSREARGYGIRHQQVRAKFSELVLAGGVRCARCGDPIQPGEPWDLGHVDGDRNRYSGPEHRACNRSTNSRRWEPAPPEPEPERPGLEADDECWNVPWLKGLRKIPKDATWPRYMTVPHPRAVGSLGPAFIRWAKAREGIPLRWWQKLAATRLLEVDSEGRLVWEGLVLSTARQVGKSWFLRELILWRIHQGERFGEPQDIVHTGKDLRICNEIQSRARAWARQRPGEYKVREVNGQEQIEHLADGSRWMLRAKEAAYGLSVSVAAVDEAWKVRQETLSESIIPTMVEREQPQLWLISTAHRLATPLMMRRRKLALEHLEDGERDLLVEWSAPREAGLDELEAWRLASPHWTPQRERTIAEQLEAMRAGEVYQGAEEPDPEASFRTQWLNQWPERLTEPPGNWEDLLPPGMWFSLSEPGLDGSEPVFVAIEDDFGRGAGVAAVARLEDGRLEVDALEFEDWDSAVEWVEQLALHRRILELHVGASMLDRLPLNGALPRARPALSKTTAAGLSVFRDLAAGRMLVHDETTELDEALQQTQVRESPSGLQIARGPRHLIKAVAWAVAAAHRPARVFAIG